MAAAAILDFIGTNIWQYFSGTPLIRSPRMALYKCILTDWLIFSHCAKLCANMCNTDRVMGVKRSRNRPPPPSWIYFVSVLVTWPVSGSSCLYFCQILQMYLKQCLRYSVLLKNSKWWRPPTLIMHHLRSLLVDLKSHIKFGVDRTCPFQDIWFENFANVAQMPIHPKINIFGGFNPNTLFFLLRPLKGTYLARNMHFKPSLVAVGCAVRPTRGPKNTKSKKVAPIVRQKTGCLHTCPWLADLHQISHAGLCPRYVS